MLERREKHERNFEKLVFYFQYPFVWYALIVGVLIALCSSLLGVTLVLKRFSFIGDGLSHVAFGAMAIASVLNFSNNMLFVMPVTVICAVLLLRTGQSTKIKGDAAIAMISVGALAVGYLLMNVFSTGSNISGDVCSSLFGSTSILTLTTSEVWLCVVVSVIVVALFTVFYHKIFAVTFDEKFCKSYWNQDRYVQSSDCGDHSSDHCTGYESGGVPVDLSFDYFPGTVGNEDL